MFVVNATSPSEKSLVFNPEIVFVHDLIGENAIISTSSKSKAEFSFEQLIPLDIFEKNVQKQIVYPIDANKMNKGILYLYRSNQICLIII